MKIYALQYSSEEDEITYGYFTSREKAEKAKFELLKNIGEDMLQFWNREVCIYEVALDKLINKIN